MSVEFFLELLAEGWTEARITEAYDQLTPDDIRAAIQYATDVLKRERVYPSAV